MKSLIKIEEYIFYKLCVNLSRTKKKIKLTNYVGSQTNDKFSVYYNVETNKLIPDWFPV